jgi:hypothetical protein
MVILLCLVLIVCALYVFARWEGSSRSPNVTLERPRGKALREFFTQVHGINHKNDDGSSRQEIIRRCREGEEVQLVPEPTNRYDANAVKICRLNGEQLGYWQADGRIAHDLAIGWTYRVTIDEIYPYQEDSRKHGVRLRVSVLTMSRTTEARKLKRSSAQKDG